MCVELPAELIAEGGARSSGRATDVSLGGARLETDAPPPVGSTLVVRLQLPGSPREVALPATVRWTRPGLVGLQFGLLGARETHLLASFAAEQARRAG